MIKKGNVTSDLPSIIGPPLYDTNLQTYKFIFAGGFWPLLGLFALVILSVVIGYLSLRQILRRRQQGAFVRNIRVQIMTIFQAIADEEFFESFTIKYNRKIICRIDYVQAKKYGVSTAEEYRFSHFGFCSIWDLWYAKSIEFKIFCLQNIETQTRLEGFYSLVVDRELLTEFLRDKTDKGQDMEKFLKRGPLADSQTKRNVIEEIVRKLAGSQMRKGTIATKILHTIATIGTNSSLSDYSPLISFAFTLKYSHSAKSFRSLHWSNIWLQDNSDS